MSDYKLDIYLSDEEKKLFTKEERNIPYDDFYAILKGEKGSFAELSGEDIDKAMVLMKAAARCREQDPITSADVYLFGNTLESEAQFQLKVQAAVIKKIRAEAGLSQQELSDLSEIKKRTLENWEQGERKITRCALYYLIERSSANEDELFKVVQFHTTDDELGDESLGLLKKLSKCEFREVVNGHDASDYPPVRYMNRSMMNAGEYLIRVERAEYITDGKVSHKHDLFPADLKEIMDYAVSNHCDEVIISLSDEPSSYVEFMYKNARRGR